jgi:hypothetical protein
MKDFNLTCRLCGCLDIVLLSDLEATTRRERVEINDQGLKLSRVGQSDQRPFLKFKLYCLACGGRTQVAIEEISCSRVRLRSNEDSAR